MNETDQAAREGRSGATVKDSSDATPALLMVDDHPSNLLALEAVLDPLGYRVVRAASGAEALRRAGEQDFVLILMDVHMPDLDGYQTTALLRAIERARDVPVIFLTAQSHEPEHTYRGYDLGAVDYITKPFDPHVLRGKVRALVSLYTRGQHIERERSLEGERIKDLFLGALGHDLRNPLNAILMASQMLVDAGSGAPPGRYAERIHRAARRMHRMIEDILDLTRGQFAGGIPVSPQPMDLGEVAREVIEEVRLVRPRRVVKLDIAGDVRGSWDPERLGRVVSNLVGNAVVHSEDGPVRVGLRGDDQRIWLEVHNGGKPIAPEFQGTLFDPFYRGDSSANGLGLGLHIVREIVRAHHGSIDVLSTQEEGTTFTVTLPRSLAPREG